MRVWTIILALAGPCLTLGVARQLYTAALQGYIMTGHSMNRKVRRKENPKLFRNNVIINVVALPLLAGGSVVLVAEALDALHR